MKFVALALLTLGLACSPKAGADKPLDDRGVCCAECRDGASKDPQGRDLSLLDCGQYASTDRCTRWFRDHPTFVQDCG